ncbi:glucose 1-dehydrogenase [Sphingobium sp. Sx8-8]|uniref:SDR family NAD(P)-dependent oxidoreductase n=1 Tax=Sphingobium sp. Sx8-8 TaxID=2933617 RepID=UPI001F5950E0|nr:glucose 1-dehydrogenase [Sphingobium sp. Sx8-8]
MLLEGKSVVITGAGSGVGRAASLLFAQHGARLVCVDINMEWAEETARQVREAGGMAEALRCDVRVYDEVAGAIDRAVAAYGRLDVMYNNAGVATATDGRPHRLIDQDDGDFERLVSINFRGVVYGCQAAVRTFLKQGGGGVIVNTASVAGMIGWGGVMYGATKGAVIQLTRGLAIEVASHGIRVNSVCPAGMVTNFGRDDGQGFEADDDKVAAYAAQHPLGRVIEPVDCANAALFLASDLSRNVTGVLLPVDGGKIAG